MSNEAINWALAQQVKSSAKFVLVAMANLAGDEMTCWPSYKHLTDATCQDVKTVQGAIHRLRDLGYITDTGERKGITGQVIVYRLNTPEYGGVIPPTKTPAIPTNTPVIGVVAKTPVFPSNTPVFPGKDPRFSHETPPKAVDGYPKDTLKNPKGTGERVRAALLPDVDPQVLADWQAVRKAKKAGDLTETAVKGLRREAGKAGLTAEQAIEVCCGYGWQGFNAKWYAERQGSATNGRQQATGETAYQRNMRERMQALVPSIAAKAPGSHLNVIDMETSNVTPFRLG